MTTVKERKYKSVTGNSTLERPRYSPGLLLEDEDLTSAVSYTRNMMRLMFRSLFGCGVICGLDVKAELTCNRSRVDAVIAKGVALDCLGNPIEIPKDIKIAFDADCDTIPACLWVVVCYRESCCRAKDVSCAPDDDGQVVQTRIKEGFEVRLYPSWPKCACSCEPPPPGKTRTRGDCCDDDDDDTTPATTGTTATTATAQAATASPSRSATAQVMTGGTSQTLYPEPPTLPPLCDCYQEHYDGKCSCDCCCPCVLVGKIHTGKKDNGDPIDPLTNDPQPLQVDRGWVRWIRPVLVGYYKCIKAVATTTP